MTSIDDQLKYKDYLELNIAKDVDIVFKEIKGDKTLRDIGDILYKKAYKTLKIKEKYIIDFLEEVKSYRKKINEKVSSDRVFVFNDLVEKSKNREQVIKGLTLLINKDLHIDICGKKIDIKNINYSLYEEELVNIKNNIEKIKEDKKIKLKELIIIKNNINELSLYSSFVNKYNLSIPYKIKSDNKNENIFFIDFKKIKENISLFKLNYMYSKFIKNEKRNFFKDEIKFLMLLNEKEKIKDSLKEINEKSLSLDNELIKIEYFNNEVSNLKNNTCFYKHLKKFFSLHFDDNKLIKYLINNYEKNNTKFDLPSNIAFSNFFVGLISSLEKDLFIIKNIMNDLDLFIRKIRLNQYKRKTKIFKIDFSYLDNDLEEFFEYIEDKICFFKNNKNIFLKNKINKKFNSWQEAYFFIMTDFSNIESNEKSLIYIYNEELKLILSEERFNEINKNNIEINFNSLIEIAKEVNYMLKKLIV